MRVRSGLDCLRARGFAGLRGRRVGLLAHGASVAGDLARAVDLVTGAGLDLRVVFTPEHGMDGAAQDMQPVPDGSLQERLAVVSLYGEDAESLHPPADVLDDLDVLVVDLQDIGSRYYTYAVTMRYCLEACARAGVAVVVLDRPNPLGGELVEGPVLSGACRSFVGGYPVPVRHGLTLAELARLATDDGVDVELETVPMEGWRRRMWFDQTGLPWVMPSPNMPTLDTAAVYPGSCLLEATNLSEGRGTTRPFELLGAPWLDGARLAAELEELQFKGVQFRVVRFAPAFHKHRGRTCGGIQLHVLDRNRFQPFATGVAVLQEARRLSGDHFGWRQAPYEFVGDRPAIDLLTGGPEVRMALDAGESPLSLQAEWDRACRAFRVRRRGILLYPGECA